MALMSRITASLVIVWMRLFEKETTTGGLPFNDLRGSEHHSQMTEFFLVH